MIANADRITETILEHLREEVRCTLLSEEDGRIGCVTPLEYPNRDNVVIWISQATPTVLITDYGEALADYAAWTRKDQRRELETIVRSACRSFGVEAGGGRLFANGSLDQVGELVWRVALAAAQVSHGASALRPQTAKREESDFGKRVTRMLKRSLAERNVDVQVERAIRGRSGHEHRATIFIPTSESVIEPVTGNWNQVNATYTKLGDLHNANGFHLYSLLDDERAGEEVADLLAQVSDVVQWSRREEWLEAVS